MEWLALFVGLFLGLVIGTLAGETSVYKGWNGVLKSTLDRIGKQLHEDKIVSLSVILSSGIEDDGGEDDLLMLDPSSEAWRNN